MMPPFHPSTPNSSCPGEVQCSTSDKYIDTSLIKYPIALASVRRSKTVRELGVPTAYERTFPQVPTPSKQQTNRMPQAYHHV